MSTRVPSPELLAALDACAVVGAPEFEEPGGQAEGGLKPSWQARRCRPFTARGWSPGTCAPARHQLQGIRG